MIASLYGTVEALNLHQVVLCVGGVGYGIYCPPDTLAKLQVGREAKIFTSLVVREDSITLYGFIDEDTKNGFEAITSVSGFGPKVALDMLSVMTIDQLRDAVARKDVKAIAKTPRVGNKLAQKFLLDINTKLGVSTTAENDSTDIKLSENDSEKLNLVMQAITNLGWKSIQVDAVLSRLKQDNANLSLSVADLLRIALQSIGEK